MSDTIVVWRVWILWQDSRIVKCVLVFCMMCSCVKRNKQIYLDWCETVRRLLVTPIVNRCHENHLPTSHPLEHQALRVQSLRAIVIIREVV